MVRFYVHLIGARTRIYWVPAFAGMTSELVQWLHYVERLEVERPTG